MAHVGGVAPPAATAATVDRRTPRRSFIGVRGTVIAAPQRRGRAAGSGSDDGAMIGGAAACGVGRRIGVRGGAGAIGTEGTGATVVRRIGVRGADGRGARSSLPAVRFLDQSPEQRAVPVQQRGVPRGS